MRRSIIAFISVSFFFLPALAQRRQTERETDGLRGTVKTTVTEIVRLKNVSGKLGEYDRQPESTITYDVEGNRLFRKLYHYGSLLESVRYGRLDGDRVAIYANVKIKSFLSGRPVHSVSKPTQRPDPRYTYKYKYKYDDKGRLSEKSSYFHDGAFWMKYTYEFRGNQKEELVYAEDGSLNQRYLYSLDDKGNEVEMLIYDTPNHQNNSVSSKVTYKYVEFDAKGNWTKRIALVGDRDNGFALEPTEAWYRKIIYF